MANILPKGLHNVTFKDGTCWHFIFYFHKRNDRIPELHVLFRKKHVLCSLSNTGKSMMQLHGERKG